MSSTNSSSSRRLCEVGRLLRRCNIRNDLLTSVSRATGQTAPGQLCAKIISYFKPFSCCYLVLTGCAIPPAFMRAVRHNRLLNGIGFLQVCPGDVVLKQEYEMFCRVEAVQNTGGAVPSPFNCRPVSRVIRTLPYRMCVHSENAAKVVAYLGGRSVVEMVHCPGLESHPGHQTAAKQISFFGGIWSV